MLLCPGAAGGTSAPEGTGAEPPTLTINGDNPATITVGDSYPDLGAPSSARRTPSSGEVAATLSDDLFAAIDADNSNPNVSSRNIHEHAHQFVVVGLLTLPPRAPDSLMLGGNSPETGFAFPEGLAQQRRWHTPNVIKPARQQDLCEGPHDVVKSDKNKAEFLTALTVWLDSERTSMTVFCHIKKAVLDWLQASCVKSTGNLKGTEKPWVCCITSCRCLSDYRPPPAFS